MRAEASLFMLAALAAVAGEGLPSVVVAEGEAFKPLDEKGWRVAQQNDSYASHTYGGMWVTHGGLLSAPADSVNSVAVQAVVIPAAGKYRVWSKYQAPPYFNYLHKIEVVQNGKALYSRVYGKEGTPRLWSFCEKSDVLWWPWGVDHDAAEAPQEMADLAAGPAEIRLETVVNEQPAGDRMVDFVLLTTSPADDCEGFKKKAVGTPFAFEALAATKLYLRFQNSGNAAVQLTVTRAGHFQPNYGGATQKFPAKAVEPSQWSEWFDIGPFCRLVHNEGLWLTLPGAAEFPVQVARDAEGKDIVGDVKLPSGQVIVIPLDITWRKDARVLTSRQHAEQVVALSKTWRKANDGKKPRTILYYGDFRCKDPWVAQLKDALGYNTLLPAPYETVKPDGLHAHVFGVDAIRQFAAKLENKKDFLVLSFGDEISLGEINYKDAAMQAKFVAWLKEKKITRDDLAVAPEEAKLAKDGSARLTWYSNLFNEEERFAAYRECTKAAVEAIGPHVLTGANYSPHHLALFYGPVFQWVDLFRHNGMSMFWAEDYVFSVPEVPQIVSWQFAQARCGVKYHGQPIHFYVMPHAPGQTPENLRRNMVLSVGYGARHINNFWVAPEEDFTENYVAWGCNDTFRVLSESIFDSAEAEKLVGGGKLRHARVAVVLSKATDFNESRMKTDKAKDHFARNSANAPKEIAQTLCRKEQQYLYLALKHAQHAVDLITEDDIVELDALKQYEVVYFAGEWIDGRAVQKLGEWVRDGGMLYASAGMGHLNQFNEPEPAMLKLLGLKSVTMEKNLVVLRTLLELPLAPPVGTMVMDGRKIAGIGMKQALALDGAKPLAVWEDGSAAVAVHELGKGKAFAVGTMAGAAYVKTGLRKAPYARGGRHAVYNPTEFDPAAAKLAWLGVEARPLARDARCSNPLVEAIVMDHAEGTLVTLVNWTNSPLKDLTLQVKMDKAPRSVRSVEGQKELPAQFNGGVVVVTTDLKEADYILMLK